MAKIRVGVVGCGEIAQVMHLPFLAELPQFEIAAICDISENVLRYVGDQYAVERRFRDYQDVFPHVDVVAVLTFDHVDIAEAAAQAGKHLFVEKPLSFSPADCTRILSAVERSGVKLMVGYMKRFNPGYIYAAQRIRAMKGVRLIRMHDFAGSFDAHRRVYTLHVADDVSADERAQLQHKITTAMRMALGPTHESFTDIYFELLLSGTHDLTVLRGIFGQAESVRYSEPLGAVGIISVLDYGGERRCVFEADMETAHAWWDQTLVVYGTDETISIDFPDPYIRYAPAAVVIKHNDGTAAVTRHVSASYEEAFRREWLHLADCIEQDREPLTSGTDAKADVELAVAMVRAISTPSGKAGEAAGAGIG